jgi:hypothetical protein
MDGLEGAVAQAVSESVAITRSGSDRFQQAVFGFGTFSRPTETDPQNRATRN